MFKVTFMRGPGLVGLRLVLAPRRPAATLHGRHPGRRTARGILPGHGQTLHYGDGFRADLIPRRRDLETKHSAFNASRTHLRKAHGFPLALSMSWYSSSSFHHLIPRAWSCR